MTPPAWLTRRPIAHRGLHGLSPSHVENCPLAFAAAIEGEYAIECDIQITKDGDAVVFHDYTLERLTHESGEVRARTLAELQQVRFKNTDDTMLSLRALLALVKGRVPLIIEVKSRFDGDMRLVEHAAELVGTYDGPACIMSFDPDIVGWLRTQRPDIVRGVVAETHYGHEEWQRVPADKLKAMRDFSHQASTDPHFLSWHWKDLPNAVTSRFRNDLKRPLICWTIRDEEAKAVAAREADQVTFEGYRA